MTDDTDPDIRSVDNDTIEAHHRHLDQLARMLAFESIIEAQRLVVETAEGERLEITARDGSVVITRD